MVDKAKELIAAGDIFQVVLSQRFETEFRRRGARSLSRLRFGNPSPYMFCLRFDPKFAVLGSSPEVHFESATESPRFGRSPERIRAEKIQPKTNSLPSSYLPIQKNAPST